MNDSGRKCITPGSYFFTNKNAETLPPEELKDDEDVTAKIPITIFQKLNQPYLGDKPILFGRIILFQAKDSYQEYYTAAIYGALIKSENDICWFGIPIKNPTMGLMKWDKKVWNKIYSFNLNISID